jgi:hypothetical protein
LGVIGEESQLSRDIIYATTVSITTVVRSIAILRTTYFFETFYRIIRRTNVLRRYITTSCETNHVECSHGDKG